MSPPQPRWRARLCYAACALATVAVGLLVHREALPLAGRARDVAGDALWAAMVYWLVSAAVPRANVRTRGAAALTIAWAVEFGQLVRTPWLLAVRATTLSHLVLGADFDARDLAAYALGVAATALAEAGGGRRVRRARGG